ncbi:MAG: hypothetical protein AMS22_08865 [Thiotrichales bacterium SG8_50]|nr:MAG: hypothetical protein AMS22_08865 [Thiotrichales bacterium SG8_50]
MGIQHRLASLCFPLFVERLVGTDGHHGGINILMYHEVLPDSMNMPLWHVVRESEFRRQMEYLKKHCDVLSIDEAVEILTSPTKSGAGSRRKIVITFDDGYSGNYSTAMPIMAELGLPWTVYVATSAVEGGDRYWYDDIAHALLVAPDRSRTIATSKGDVQFQRFDISESRVWLAVHKSLELLKLLPAEERDRLARQMHEYVDENPLEMMTPEQIAVLAEASEVIVGCHTHDHNLLDMVTLDHARQSIEDAQQRLDSWCGSRPRHFSYPNGNFNGQVVNLVDKFGFDSAVTTESRMAIPGDHLLKLPRIAVGRFDNLNLFRAKLTFALKPDSSF